MSTALPPVRWFGVVVALVLLHVWTSFRLPFEQPSWGGSWWYVSPDLMVLLSVGTLVALRWGYHWVLGQLAAALLLWVAVLRVAETVMHSFMHRELVLHTDVLMLEGGWRYLAGDRPGACEWSIVAGVGLALIVLWVLLAWAVGRVFRAAARPGFGYGVLIACQSVVVALWCEGSARHSVPSRIVGSSMLNRTLLQAARSLSDRPWGYVDLLAERQYAAEQERARHPTNLQKLGGADVYVAFVESYGRVLFSNPDRARQFTERLPVFAKALTDVGFASCSSFVRPPVLGAESQVSHAELLVGFRLDNYRQADLVLDTTAKAMPRFFHDAGYHAVSVQPKLLVEWPRGKFFGFDQDLFGVHTTYQQDGGVLYHWAHAPDQYILELLLRDVVRPSKKPVFAQFISASSHSPFAMVAPYLTDWSKASDPRSFTPVRRYDIGLVSYITDPRAVQAYLETIDYSLQTLIGFAGELARAGRSAVLIVLGDHQPPLLVQERKTFDVPIHVWSNRKELLEPFRMRGFVAGLVPPPGTVSFRLERVLPRLLQDFSK